MNWISLFFASTIKSITANEQCRTEVNIHGMALKRFVFKRRSLAAPHLCDVKCGQGITSQSNNYNRKYQICELNNRTKQARPENFRSAPSWFYIRRLNGRSKKSKVYVPRCFCSFSRFSPHSANLVPVLLMINKIKNGKKRNTYFYGSSFGFYSGDILSRNKGK